MLISALCDYYDVLAKKGLLCPEGYSNVKVHYLIALNPDGTIADIIDWQVTETVKDKKGKEKETKNPRIVVMPKRTEKPGIDANYIEHRPLYIFGLNPDADRFTTEDRTGKARKSHAVFVEANIKLIEGIDSPVVNAYRAFIQNWTPEAECENPQLLKLGKSYTGSGYAFCLSGRTDLLLHDDPEVKRRFEALNVQNSDAKDSFTAQCAITGETMPIAKIHGKISGMGNATGSVLIGYNDDAFCSYNNGSSYNSNVSELAANKYVQALNYLASSKAHRILIDDIRVLFWAADGSERNDDIMAMLLSQDSAQGADEVNNRLKNLMSAAREGRVVADELKTDGIDPNVDFYIVGIMPNVARLALKFIYRKRFGDILQNIAQHQNDMQVDKELKPVPLWKIKRELISPKSSNAKVDTALMSKIFEAIVNGTQYPEYLLSTVVMRVKTDADIKVNYESFCIRAGIIKACINRKSRYTKKKEELTLALNTENTNPAYLCGRLFAALEKLQREASGDLNRTIKDAYFASASSRPVLVFPKIIKLAQNHLKKLESQGRRIFFDKLIGDIMLMLDDGFPESLNLTQQGNFIIGYYQQYQSFFEKNENKNNTTISEEE